MLLLHELVVLRWALVLRHLVPPRSATALHRLIARRWMLVLCHLVLPRWALVLRCLVVLRSAFALHCLILFQSVSLSRRLAVVYEADPTLRCSAFDQYDGNTHSDCAFCFLGCGRPCIEIVARDTYHME
jgi:hypothetical protein